MSVSILFGHDELDVADLFFWTEVFAVRPARANKS
jgi:hypothetical protein